jgi:methylthioribulose-1-phosphate dehydratase
LPADATEPAAALLECARKIRGRGWCDGTSGNFSVTLTRAPLRLLITPTGVDKAELEAQDLLVLDERVLATGAGQAPSAEAPLHVALALRAGAGAVLHTHSVWNTLLGEHFRQRGGFVLSGYEMLKGLDGVRSHREEVFVPVVENTQDMPALAAEVERLLGERPALRGFLIAGHGLYTWGRGLVEAHRHVEIFEFLFQLAGRRIPLRPFSGTA